MNDEMQFWADVSNKPKSRDEKEFARGFYQALEPMVKDIRCVSRLCRFRPESKSIDRMKVNDTQCQEISKMSIIKKC